MNDDADVVVVMAPLIPTEWSVRCPCCSQWLAVDGVREQSSGAYAAEAEDQFILCGCGVVVECQPVVVENPR